MTKVSVIGSISMDLVTRTNRVPNAGETVFGEDFAMVPGGKGANQAVAFARLSPNEVSMIGAVGKDAFGESILQNFKENAVLFENKNPGDAVKDLMMRDGKAEHNAKPWS